MSITSATPCSDRELEHLLALMGEDHPEAEPRLASALRDHPQDARLHFLHGSSLASLRDYDGARAAMQRAVELRPDFAVARFQLGLLHFTSGAVETARETWALLRHQQSNDAFRSFVLGLECLAENQFGDALILLEEGMKLNQENAPLNRDMALLADEIRRHQAGSNATPAAEESLSSAAQQLLQQVALRSTRH